MQYPIGDKRAANLERLRTEQFDVLIAGGGINGAGIARDLTLRGVGLRVALLEKNQFASGTSSRNSQLIHGGLRYLKYLQFDLVHEALREQATLLKIAPGLVSPLEFLLPCYRAFDRWFYRAGLALYQILGAQAAHSLSRETVTSLEPHLARHNLRAGLMFSDCLVHSARLVIENIVDAEARGAAVANHVEWRGDHAFDRLSGRQFAIRARRIVDATGAWSEAGQLRLVRGSHLIFPRIQAGNEAISYFDEQGRIVFLIPWGENHDLTLVGTTDVDHHGSLDDVRISPEETSYLYAIVRRLYPEYRGEHISSYSALRPLIPEAGRSATSTSREHRIRGTADGVLHIAGGKYTTYRAMSEELVDALLPDLRPGHDYPSRTAEVPL
ncbi:MAG TPA: glycerol-3-phosphate dehydrogenase/oxidase, partial [Bryobacteraceae bacterium]|nr:glycerol-3-phosphate dehydrogenase/oxidase [Bryobacteraceae bacterium]